MPREERSCPLCKSEVEDINHFLLKCDKLEESRRVFFDKFYSLAGESFEVRPLLLQARKIPNLDFKDKRIIATISKGVFDLYKLQLRLEKDKFK